MCVLEKAIQVPLLDNGKVRVIVRMILLEKFRLTLCIAV